MVPRYSNHSHNPSAWPVIAFMLFILFMMCGWVMNIYQLIQHTGDWTGFYIVKAIGVVIGPLGAVLGWIGT